MDELPNPETLVRPTRPMDASDALYLNTLCDRRDAAMLSPFTDAEDLLADDASIAGDEQVAGEAADNPLASRAASS